MLKYNRIDISEGIDTNKCIYIYQKNVVYASFIIF